jgi:hypothetical protein
MLNYSKAHIFSNQSSYFCSGGGVPLLASAGSGSVLTVGGGGSACVAGRLAGGDPFMRRLPRMRNPRPRPSTGIISTRRLCRGGRPFAPRRQPLVKNCFNENLGQFAQCTQVQVKTMFVLYKC